MADQETNGTIPAEATRTEPVFTPPTDIIETTSAVQMLLDMPVRVPADVAREIGAAQKPA